MPRLRSLKLGLPRDIAWEARPFAPPFGRRQFKAGAWYGGSTLTATGKGTWLGTAASTGQFVRDN
jgi:hypothetical protein